MPRRSRLPTRAGDRKRVSTMYDAMIARKSASGVDMTLFSSIGLKARGILSTAIKRGPEPGLLAQRLTSISIFEILNCPREKTVIGRRRDEIGRRGIGR